MQLLSQQPGTKNTKAAEALRRSWGPTHRAGCAPDPPGRLCCILATLSSSRQPRSCRGAAKWFRNNHSRERELQIHIALSGRSEGLGRDGQDCIILGP